MVESPPFDDVSVYEHGELFGVVNSGTEVRGGETVKASEHESQHVRVHKPALAVVAFPAEQGDFLACFVAQLVRHRRHLPYARKRIITDARPERHSPPSSPAANPKKREITFTYTLPP
jgi:hypothetical protein